MVSLLIPLNPMHRAMVLTLLLVPAICLADLLRGQIVGVHDGDTVTLLDSSSALHKIRLAGIDAPELGQAFGRRSKEELSREVFGKPATVEWSKRDRYGRLVGKVVVDGRDANLAQVGKGFAWHYTAYAAEQPLVDRVAYKEGQTRAREARLGLWEDDQPLPPWDYRRKGRAKRVFWGISPPRAEAVTSSRSSSPLYFLHLRQCLELIRRAIAGRGRHSMGHHYHPVRRPSRTLGASRGSCCRRASYLALGTTLRPGRMSEDEIIRGVLSHGAAQRKALEAFYGGVGRHMKASFLHWGASAEDAADILQETAIRVFRHAASYQGRGAARAWLWQIARNSFVDHFRAKRLSAPESQSEAERSDDEMENEQTIHGAAGTFDGSSHMAPANEVTPSRTIVFVPVEKIDEALHYTEPDIPVGALDECVQAGLKAFGAQYPERQLCLFLQMEGATVEEIAAQIGRKPGATREFLSQCRKKLEPFVSRCRELIPA